MSLQRVLSWQRFTLKYLQVLESAPGASQFPTWDEFVSAHTSAAFVTLVSVGALPQPCGAAAAAMRGTRGAQAKLGKDMKVSGIIWIRKPV